MTGDISFSDPNLNAVQHITRAVAMSNFQSIPTVPRKAAGWGCPALCRDQRLQFRYGGLYTSFVQQINDAQDPKLAVCRIVFHGTITGMNLPIRPGAPVHLIADWVQTYFDDDRIFFNHYDGIKAHLESLKAQAKVDQDNGLLDFSWWGDWCPPAGCVKERSP